MSNERFARIKSIVLSALNVPTGERAAYLDVACADDDEIRREVDAKLAQADRELSFLESGGELKILRADAAQDGATTVQRPPDERLGEVVSHYRLEQFLGAGAMGQVYRATDVALGRQAAVKLLRTDVNPALRRRLVQEGRTGLRLTHPAIAQFYDAGEADGVDFLAMEFAPGETLRARLQHGALTPTEALSITCSLLEALAHAHGAGFLHRDIKPENIVITPEGAPKLLDFGIAKWIGDQQASEDTAADTTPPDLSAAMTMHGMILGTPGYMSPEQLLGDQVNESVDVFAVGAVLFEMLSGERAFPGQSWSERAATTLAGDLPSVQKDDRRDDLDLVLRRALARDPEERYPDATAFLGDLRRVATGEAVALLPRTLAILDLQNLSGDAEDDWIGSGVAESLGADLGLADGLDLVARDTVLKARARLAKLDRPSDPVGLGPAVALGLAVACRWVLTGSYQRVGGDLRLTMRLVEVATSKDLWTEKLDGPVDDIFSMQDRLAALTAESLSAVLPPETSRSSTSAMDAFEHYARARALLRTWDRSALEQAYRHLQKALESEPDHAPALAALAQFHAPGKWAMTGDPRLLETSLEYATRAVAADPAVAAGHTFQGYAYWRMGRFEQAIDALERAIAGDDRNYLAWYFLGCCHADQSRWRDALDAQQRAGAIDPKVPFVFHNLGNNLAALGDLEAARWAAARGVELEQDPESVGWIGCGVVLAEVLRRDGKPAEARAVCLDTLESIESKDNFVRALHLPQTLAVMGRVCLDQDDLSAAEVSFAQGAALISDQPAGISAGHSLVQCLAGQTRCGLGAEPFERGLRLFDDRTEYGFSWGCTAADCYTLLELSKAARSLGRDGAAGVLLQRARDAGVTGLWENA